MARWRAPQGGLPPLQPRPCGRSARRGEHPAPHTPGKGVPPSTRIRAAHMTASGHYHCSVKSVGRGNGASIIAKAAYRSGERLFDETTQEWKDYTKREHSVLDVFMELPEVAPPQTRQQLWNAAERAEPRTNGRLATELELGLPHELSAAQRRELLSNFVRKIVEEHGVAADVAIHSAEDDRNIHAHVLLSHRELGADGFGEIANSRTVTRKRNGEQVQEKVAGIAATPADIRAIRQEWERNVNRAYERAGLDIRVDHRSHKDRGIEDEPTKHLGPNAAGMERNGKTSDRGDVNRDIEQRNAEQRALRALEAEARQLGVKIIEVEFQGAAREAHAGARGRVDDIRPRPPEAERVAEPSSSTRPAAANQNTHVELTLEGIARDPWMAVDAPLPKETDRTLLATVALAADQCAKYAFAATRVSEVIEPELAGYYRDRQTDAAERRDEARQRLEGLAPEQVAKVSPFLHPEQMQERAMFSMGATMRERRATGEEPHGPVTAEAIDKNPWNAVTLDLPNDENRALLERIAATAYELKNMAAYRSEGAYTREEAELWQLVAEEAKTRSKDAGHELAMIEVRAAWRAPEFSGATIAADPWTAVYLPMPDKPDAALLAEARQWVSELRNAVEDRPGWEPSTGALAHGPFVDGMDYSRQENFAAATARLAELDSRLEIAPEGARTPEPTAAPEPSTARTTPHEPAPEPSFTAPEQEAGGIRSFGGFLGGILGAVAKPFENLISYLGNFISPAPPPTKDQAERMQRAEEEAAPRREAQHNAAEYEARLRELLQQDARSRALRRELGQEYDHDDDRGREREC
jgi:hypothetical protein